MTAWASSLLNSNALCDSLSLSDKQLPLSICFSFSPSHVLLVCDWVYSNLLSSKAFCKSLSASNIFLFSSWIFFRFSNSSKLCLSALSSSSCAVLSLSPETVVHVDLKTSILVLGLLGVFLSDMKLLSLILSDWSGLMSL